MRLEDAQAVEAYGRFRLGDESAFEEIVAAYRRGLRNYINGFVNDTREADELAIDAFAELAAGMNFNGDSTLKTYLFTIGRRLALRHVKAYRGATRIPIDAIINALAGDENEPEAVFLLSERKEQLRAAMDALKPTYREALYLVYFEGMSYAEAGKTMRKTVY